jgi:heme exporter protein D
VKHWLLFHAGLLDPGSPWYLFYSGIGADWTRLLLLGGIVHSVRARTRHHREIRDMHERHHREHMNDGL